jgi:hypothetical protein
VAAWFGQLWVASAVMFALSILIRLVDVGQLARFDELYTMLAARGWLAHGVPRIAEGVYSRAQLYTVFIAWCLKLLGDNLVVARLPSVLFGSILAVAVFLWTNAVAGRTAAWISGLLMALASMSVEMSQYARFYALHALTFWLGSIGVYALAKGQLVGSSRRLAVALGAALCLLCALYLQVLTLIGLVGLAAWLALVGLARWCRDANQFWATLGALALGAGVMTVAAVASGFAHPFLEAYLATPLTVIQHKGEIWFYHLHLIERFPTLWPMFPLLALIAMASRPTPTLFAVCTFGVVFALLSFAGQKSLRYLFFAEPFLFVVWAIAIASLWQSLRAIVGEAITRVTRNVGPRLRPLLSGSLVVGSLVFLALANGSPARTLLRPLGIHLGEGFSARWPAAVPELDSWVRSADVVLTSHELHMLYYLGRADIVVSKERLAEFADTEFARDPRTGLPVVTLPESIELILACYPTGVMVADTIKGWRAPTVIDDHVAELIANHTTPIDLPDGSNLVAFRWQTPISVMPSAACATIPGFE